MNAALKDRLLATIGSQRVVLFMKGTQAVPQCGFSAQVVGILKKRGGQFRDVDVLSDPELRQGLKELSNWPTYPQLYVDGKLVGGADIVSALDASGELDGLLAAPT